MKTKTMDMRPGNWNENNPIANPKKEKNFPGLEVETILGTKASDKSENCSLGSQKITMLAKKRCFREIDNDSKLWKELTATKRNQMKEEIRKRWPALANRKFMGPLIDEFLSTGFAKVVEKYREFGKIGEKLEGYAWDKVVECREEKKKEMLDELKGYVDALVKARDIGSMIELACAYAKYAGTSWQKWLGEQIGAGALYDGYERPKGFIIMRGFWELLPELIKRGDDVLLMDIMRGCYPYLQREKPTTKQEIKEGLMLLYNSEKRQLVKEIFERNTSVGSDLEMLRFWRGFLAQSNAPYGDVKAMDDKINEMEPKEQVARENAGNYSWKGH
jgi:hypothetical protein